MISIVVPVYNSEKILPTLCHKIDQEMIKNNYTYELILVNDASRDNSETVIRNLSKKNSHIKAILLDTNAGQQNSTLAGIRLAKYDLILTMDDDLQHHPCNIKKLIDSLDAETDIVYAVPKISNTKFYRLFGTSFKELCFFVFFNKPKNIHLTSFRLMRGELIQWIKSDPLPKVYISARALQSNPIIKNIEIPYNPRFEGDSNYTPLSLIKKLLSLIWNYKIKLRFCKNKSDSTQYSIKEILK